MTKANPALLAGTAEKKAVGCGGWTMERPSSDETTAGLGNMRHFATHPDWAGRGSPRR